MMLGKFMEGNANIRNWSDYKLASPKCSIDLKVPLPGPDQHNIMIPLTTQR